LGGLLTLTVVAAPIGIGLMQYGKFLFWPFGNAMVSRRELGEVQNRVWGIYSSIVAILFIPFGIVLGVMAAVQTLALFLTVVGIPPGLVLAKSLGTYFNPVNKKCVPSAVRDDLDRRLASSAVDKHLGVQPH
jgi:uncharacterized membrane protein YccF (DUF307 family)